MATLFKNAKVIAATAPKGRKAEVEEVQMAGLERFAALDAAIKSLTALKEVEEANLKQSALARFVDKGCIKKARPENFKGLDNSAEASIQLKIRSSASVLSEDEQKLLSDAGVSYEASVKREEAFLINPKYSDDMTLLEKVEAALENVDLPEDFLMRQEKIEVQIASTKSMEEVFAKLGQVDAAKLLPLVSTLAIKASLKGDCFAILDTMLNPVEDEAK